MLVAGQGLAALAVAMGIGRFAFTPLLPMMQSDAGLSLARGGWLASANYAGYFIGALWAAAQPARAQLAVRAGLAAIGLATLAMGFTQGLPAWLLLRAVAGVASAWVLVHVSSWALARLAPLGRPSLFGIVYSGVGAGIVLAGLACLGLMAQGRSSSQGWIGLGAIALVVSSALWRGFGGAVQEGASPVARFRWSADRVRMLAAYGAFGFGYIVPATYIPALARQSIPDPAVFGWAWPLFGAAAAVSTLGAARLLRTSSPRQVWIGAQLVMALGVAAPLGLRGWAGIAIGAVLVGATFVVVTMVGLQEARRTTDADAARFMAAMTAAFALGQVAGPVLVSALVGAGGQPGTALAIAAAILVAGAALLLRKA